MRKIYYFFGICGISMSTLAIFLKKQGNNVFGIDRNLESKTADFLMQNGIEIEKEINKQKLKTADMVVCSSAIKDDNPQKILAKQFGKTILSRGQILGEIAKQYKNVIAVAGSHGKTTTTALIFEILKCANKKPTLHLGGHRVEDGKNYEIGKNEYFVTEACEYCDNFLYLNPQIAVVTNIEKEHMDYFKTFERQRLSFEKFKNQSNFVIDSVGAYGAKDIFHSPDGGLNFSIFKKNEKIMDLHMQICEEVNVDNVLFAYQVAKKLGICDRVCKKAFENFEGVEMRFQRVESQFFDNVFCDYAHHPTEIEKTIETSNKIFQKNKVIIVFQPHTFSRTKTLLCEFVEALSKVENLVLFKTYSAREKSCEGVSAFELAKILRKKGKKVAYFADCEKLCNFLSGFEKTYSIVFVGAGDMQNKLNKNRFIS